MQNISFYLKNGVVEEPDTSQIGKTQVIISSDNWVDFCVWILRVDGIQFSPFTGHESGNRCLQDLGLNEEQWSKWVSRIATLNDDHLLYVEEEEEEVYLPFTEEWSEFKRLRKEFFKKRHELAISLIPKDSLQLIGCSWSEAWNGDAKILTNLLSLFNHWKSIKNNEIIEIDRDIRDIIYTHPQLECEKISILNINLIKYPIPVTYPLSTSSGILGISGVSDLHYVKDLSLELLNKIQNFQQL